MQRNIKFNDILSMPKNYFQVNYVPRELKDVTSNSIIY